MALTAGSSALGNRAQSDPLFSSRVSSSGGGAVAEGSPMHKAVPPGCRMTAETLPGNGEFQGAEKRIEEGGKGQSQVRVAKLHLP